VLPGHRNDSHETLKRNPRLRQTHDHHNTLDHSTATIQPPERPGNPSSSVPVTDLTASSVNDNPRSTGAFERGGSVQLAASPDTYELSDYKEIAERNIIDDRQRQREEKKALKRQWLETQDEMKFSHSIQFNAVPDWSSHYIAYSNLKKL
jgi:hypothetical protein